ncbi:MAG: Hsp20/alpha crystallin family protein [Vicinamibacterales bacterium]
MAMIRWDPLREMEDLSSRLGTLLAMPTSRLARENGEFGDWAPALDVEETEKEYLVKADLPAVKKEDVHISVENGMLCLEGERKQEKEEKNKRFHRVERSYGKFVRHLTLPTDVEQPKIAAEFKDGVLNVHLPKSATAKPRTIDVKVQ